MLLMLVLVGMLVYRTRDPAVWKWLAPGEEKRPAAGREVPAKALAVQAHAGASAKPQPAPEAPGNPPDAVRGRLAKSQPIQGSPAKPQPAAEPPAKPQTPLESSAKPAPADRRTKIPTSGTRWSITTPW